MAEELTDCSYNPESPCQKLKIQVQQLKLQLYEEQQNCKQLENRLRSQEKYREIVETQTELICRFLPDGTITFINLAFSRYFNQSFQELIGKTTYSLIPPVEHQPLKTYLQSLSPQASVGTYKHPIILSSGEVRWQQWIHQAFFNEQGEVIEYQAVGRDLTECKPVEEELEFAKERFEVAITASNDGFWDWDWVTGEIYFSPRWKEMIGYKDEELPNLLSSWEKVIFSEDRITALKRIEDYNSGKIERFLATQRFYHKNGSTVYILSRAIHFKDDQGRVIRMVGAHTDITELVNAQEELKQKTEILQMIIDHIPIMLAFYNSQGEIKFINRELEQVLGWSFEEIQQMNLLKACYLDPEYRQGVIDFMLSATGEWKDLKTLNRQGKLLDTAWANIRLSNGMQIGIGQDITKRKKAEVAIKQQIKWERLTQKITTKIRQSLNLDEILQTTVDEIRDLLDCDRVLCLRFYGDKTSKVVTESLAPGWSSLLGEAFPEDDFPKEYYQRYCQGFPRIIPDINQDILLPCLVKYLQSVAIKSKLIVPLLQKEKLWGLLIVHQCRYQRNWQQSEVKIILSLAAQVNMAIQQSQLYHKLEEVNQELHRLATVDGLTQVANRRYFDTYLFSEWKRLAREQLPLSLILCDVDFFKNYNDMYGHLQGDECLKKVAEILTKLAKRPADLVARYGGEEFAIILPNTDQYGAITVAQLIQKEFAKVKMIHPDSPHRYITLSQGITTCIPLPNTHFDRLIQRADDALYEAKAKGRNQAIFYQTELITN
ncbi:diguanylate cyclase domain-containing protein [Planktothrix mougeotii]|uniref:Diguanylate cyclase n=1 Tax=Planktothrix mougeotii LEGE 06226 TaxID=1828728 RepID=A0ABR9UFE1_9CYAN|nr:diguanylate cyclase [Planktothrix mougeotii]MBE9144541.1 diguanylate cyclase [Planktothrix mougeotii LEGE 06226]